MPLLYCISEMHPEGPLRTVHAEWADEYQIRIKYLGSWITTSRCFGGLRYFDTEAEANIARRYFIEAEMQRLKAEQERATARYDARMVKLIEAGLSRNMHAKMSGTAPTASTKSEK